MQVAFAGVRGALWNVVINLKDLTDAAYVADRQARSAALLAKAKVLCDEVSNGIDVKLAEMIKAKQAKAPAA